MDPVLNAVLRSWDWQLDVIVILALAGILYFRGWWRLRKRSGYGRISSPTPTKQTRWRLANGWRLTSYFAGLFFIGLALLSPIDALGELLFIFHMIQHLLLIMFAPPLLLLANPMPFMLWGLPDFGRKHVGRGLSYALHRDSVVRHTIRKVTSPGLIWLIWVISLLGWHDPNMYNAALRNEFVHGMEHLMFFGASMLLWWHVTGAGPRLHKQLGYGGRIALLMGAIPPNLLLGMVLAFATTAVYTYYTAVPRLWGIDVLADQQIGGIIMWVPGSMMYIVATLIFLFRLFDKDKEKGIRSQAPVKKQVNYGDAEKGKVRIDGDS